MLIFNILVETEKYRASSFFITVAVAIFGLSYNNIFGKNLKCPECQNKLNLQKHEINVPSKSECSQCKVIWDLGVPFKTASEHDDIHDFHHDD